MKIVLFLTSMLVLYGCGGPPSAPSNSDISDFCDSIEDVSKNSRLDQAEALAMQILTRSKVPNVAEYSAAMKEAVNYAHIANAVQGINKYFEDDAPVAGFNDHCRRNVKDQIAKVSMDLQVAKATGKLQK